ncbi:uncharacterized protein [Eurosta solidaginis]|uniref:uncharacterized protein n=1 Tax=Eurosta solidaginis TaxID=178769 RepID=UPI0035315144
MFKPIITVLMLVAFCNADTPTHLRSSLRRTNTRFLAHQQAAPAPKPTGYPAAGVTPEIPFILPSSTVKPDVTYLPPDNSYDPPSQPDVAYGPPAPHSTYGPPDNTYLPPEYNVTERVVPVEVDERDEEVEVEEEEQQPTAPQPEVQDLPEEQTGAASGEEEAEEEILVAVSDDGPVIAVSNSFDAQGVQAEAKSNPAHLVFQRFPQGRRHNGAPVDVPVPARLIKMRRTAPAKLQLAQRMQLQPQAQPLGFSYVSQYMEW